MTQLELTQVTLERGGRPLFAPLSFSASGGCLVRIAGANGAGKTTLLRALAGLTTVSTGKVDWPSTQKPENIGARRIFIGHSNAMNDSLTAQENLAFMEGAKGFPIRRDHVERALAEMGVAPLIDRRVGTLSQGQRKRVALSRLCLPSNTGAAWLLDEPFVALDLATQSLLATHIEAALRRDTLVVLTSHQDVSIASANTLEITLAPDSSTPDPRAMVQA